MRRSARAPWARRQSAIHFYASHHDRAMEELRKLVGKYSATAILEKGSTRALVFERGARLLALSVGGVNPLWVNPALEKVLETGGWNTGGLRLWISPERSFYYEKPETFEGWFCPVGVDPGNFKLVHAEPSRAVLEGVVEALDRATGWRLRARVRREFQLVAEDRLLVRDVAVAEYPGDFNLWALAQVEPGAHGTAIVPTKRGTQPVHYFGPIPQDRLAVKDDHVAFKIDGARVCKLGVRPEDLTVEGSAAIAYVAELGGKWVLLLMRTYDAPRGQGECLDPAKADPAGSKGCVQSYNSGPEAGPERFGEIELHFKPAVEVGGCKVAYAEYELVFVSGSREEVLERLKRELGLREASLF